MMCGLIFKKKNVYCQSLGVKASKFDANSSRMETLKTTRLFINPPEEGDVLVCSDACLGLPDTGPSCLVVTIYVDHFSPKYTLL